MILAFFLSFHPYGTLKSMFLTLWLYAALMFTKMLGMSPSGCSVLCPLSPLHGRGRAHPRPAAEAGHQV